MIFGFFFFIAVTDKVFIKLNLPLRGPKECFPQCQNNRFLANCGDICVGTHIHTHVHTQKCVGPSTDKGWLWKRHECVMKESHSLHFFTKDYGTLWTSLDIFLRILPNLSWKRLYAKKPLCNFFYKFTDSTQINLQAMLIKYRCIFSTIRPPPPINKQTNKCSFYFIINLHVIEVKSHAHAEREDETHSWIILLSRKRQTGFIIRISHFWVVLGYVLISLKMMKYLLYF